MSKNRQAVTCNGRPAFYAAMYEDIRYVAIHCGWAVALHGSLASDMDIIAIPWVDSATSFEYMIEKISGLFDGNMISENYLITYNEKPYGRTVATIPIWEDFYLDISTVDIRKQMQEIEERLEEELSKRHKLFLRKDRDEIQILKEAISIVEKEGGMKSSDLLNSKQYALKVLEMFLHKQCDLKRTEFAYTQEEVWKAVKMATEALEKQMKFETQ